MLLRRETNEEQNNGMRTSLEVLQKKHDVLVDRCDDLIAFILSTHEPNGLPEEVVQRYLRPRQRGETRMTSIVTEWEHNNTRCEARKKDGTRCKLHAGPDEVFCEHHAYDLRSFIRRPLHVIGLYGKYFPKQHHPACDRKEQTIATVRTYRWRL